MSTASRHFADPMAVWTVVAVALAGLVASSATLRPQRVYEAVIWRHFVGPVLADAFGASCVVRTGGSVQYASGSCPTSTVASQAIVARPTLTTVGLLGYAFLFLFLVVGGLLLLRRLDLCRGCRFLTTTVPFMFVGGSLLALRDAAATLSSGPSGALRYPVNLLLAGPIPYFVLFLCPLFCIAASGLLARADFVADYSRPAMFAAVPLFGVSVATIALVAPDWTLLGLGGAIVVLGLGTVLALGLWAIVARVAPGFVNGIGPIGLVVTWAYVVAGVTTVVAVDWPATFGFATADPATPLTRGIAGVTRFVLPESVLAVTKASWPYLFVQAGVAMLLNASFDEETVAESPMALLLLVLVVGAALVSAVRTLLLVTFGF